MLCRFFVSSQLQRKRTRGHASDPSMSTSISIPGTRVGGSVVVQAINALECYRLNNCHKWLDNKETQKPLRDDPRIRELEKSAKANEPRRIEQAQSLKASGTSAGELFLIDQVLTWLTVIQDNYSTDDLRRVVHHCLAKPRSENDLSVYVRDRAMLLFSTTMAFRGNNIRALVWSDLSYASMPIPALGPDRTIPVRACKFVVPLSAADFFAIAA